MMHVCVWTPSWSTGAGPGAERAAGLLDVAPRVAVERRGVVWADARGLPAARVAAALLERVGDVEARAGVAATPVAAELAARAPATPGGGVVEVAEDRDFIAPLPVALLGAEPRLLALLEGVGIERCGELAALDREAVEVRFGAEAVRLWRLARADDARRLFGAAPPEHPHASLDFIDYAVTDPERLVFTANALLGSVVGALRSRGEHARRLTLALSLADGGLWRRTLRPARPTASREAWLRLVRATLERVELPDAVVGLALAVEATEAAAVRQGDLFDRGFASAGAVEAALARLVEIQGEVLVEPRRDRHPLAERRTEWVPRAPDAADAPAPAPAAAEGAEGAEGAGAEDAPRLTLQLLPEPRPIDVETASRRDHQVPVRYRDRRGWTRLVTAAGPDRVSGGRWGEAYAREYFRAVTTEGVLVWLFRDGREDVWYLHGWWD